MEEEVIQKSNRDRHGIYRVQAMLPARRVLPPNERDALPVSGAREGGGGDGDRAAGPYMRGTYMMWAFGVPGNISHGFPGAGRAGIPELSSVAFGM